MPPASVSAVAKNGLKNGNGARNGLKPEAPVAPPPEPAAASPAAPEAPAPKNGQKNGTRNGVKNGHGDRNGHRHGEKNGHGGASARKNGSPNGASARPDKSDSSDRSDPSDAPTAPAVPAALDRAPAALPGAAPFEPSALQRRFVAAIAGGEDGPRTTEEACRLIRLRPATVSRWRMDARYRRWEQKELLGAIGALTGEALRALAEIFRKAEDEQVRLRAAELVLQFGLELDPEGGGPDGPGSPAHPIVTTWGDGSV